MRWSPRPSTKPTEMQAQSRQVAIDAFLEGRMADGKRLLEVEGTRLSKPQAKKTARLLVEQGRPSDAMDVLLLSMGRSQAEEELAPAPTAKVGDILYASWGYDQTNIDFYEVVAVSGSSATIRRIAERVFSRSQYEDAVVPVPGAFIGEPKKKRVQKSGTKSYSVKANGHHAHLWDGKPKYQTASGYGH